MSYYPTIDEDLTRAKEILAEGKAAAIDLGNVSLEAHAFQGAMIYGKDTYAAYKLLESFVAHIERLRAEVEDLHTDVANADDATVAAQQRSIRLLAEQVQFYGLFSDYEEPCESFEQAQAIWNEMKRREEIEREETRRLRAQTIAAEGLIRENLVVIEELRAAIKVDEQTITHNLATMEAQTAEIARLHAEVEGDADTMRLDREARDAALAEVARREEQLRQVLAGKVALRAEVDALREQIATLERESDEAGRGWKEAITLNTHLLLDIEQLHTEKRDLQRWKDAVSDACITDWIFTKAHETNPRLAVNDLLVWQARLALDPAVSQEAAKLHTQIAEQTVEIERLQGALTHNIATIEQQNATIGALREEHLGMRQAYLKSQTEVERLRARALQLVAECRIVVPHRIGETVADKKKYNEAVRDVIEKLEREL